MIKWTGLAPWEQGLGFRPESAERLVIYCQTTSVSAAHATHCATYLRAQWMVGHGSHVVSVGRGHDRCSRRGQPHLWKRECKLPWRETGPPNHHDDRVDSDQHSDRCARRGQPHLCSGSEAGPYLRLIDFCISDRCALRGQPHLRTPLSLSPSQSLTLSQSDGQANPGAACHTPHPTPNPQGTIAWVCCGDSPTGQRRRAGGRAVYQRWGGRE